MPTVLVPGVWPSGSTLSICGQVISGDGHVAGATPGWLFGTPTFRLSKAVGGVPSAQAFGVPVVTTTQRVLVGSVGSAQAFGTVRPRNIQVVVGVSSAQLFGVPTISTRRTIAVPGVPSAQAFGVARAGVTVTVVGVSSAQAFGPLTIRVAQIVQVGGVLPYGPQIDSICGEVISGDGHLCGYKGGPREQFGRVTIRTGLVTVAVGGVPSAQAFGVPRVFPVWIRDTTCFDLDLVESTPIPTPIGTAACLTNTLSICGEVICGDGHLCGGIGFNWVYGGPLDEQDLTLSPVLDLDLEPAGCR